MCLIQGALRGAGGESHRPFVALKWNEGRSKAFATSDNLAIGVSRGTSLSGTLVPSKRYHFINPDHWAHDDVAPDLE